MTKDEFLTQLKNLVQKGFITKEEIFEAIGEADSPEEIGASRQRKLSVIFSFIGVTIVFIGISILAGQNWNHLNDFTKILITLGSACAAYCSGWLLREREDAYLISESMFCLSGLLAPVGIFTTLHLSNIGIETAGMHAMVSAFLFMIFFASYYGMQKKSFLVFSIVFGTWLFFSMTSFIFQQQPFTNWNFVRYRWLAVGLSYLCLGLYFSDNEKRISSALYSYGIIAFLTAAYALIWNIPGGGKNIFWEWTFPLYAFGAMYLSVAIRNQMCLLFGAIYLIIYIFYLTGVYFSSGFGWPIALIMAGLGLMGIGYGAFYVQRNYIKDQ